MNDLMIEAKRGSDMLQKNKWNAYNVDHSQASHVI